MRAAVVWGLNRGLPILGNYHVILCQRAGDSTADFGCSA